MTKVSSIELIPAEIWENIFNQLPRCSQRECQFVCKQWYLPSQRSFLQHVVLASCYDVQTFITCFMSYGSHSSFDSVKTIRIGSTYTTPDRARKLLESNAIETIIQHFPNVTELVISGNCIELDYFLKENVLQSILDRWRKLKMFRVDSGWLHPDKRKIYLQTNYRLRERIEQLTLYEHSDVTHELGGLAPYLMSFPNLKSIKVVSREICNLESCLPVVEHSQRLEDLDVYVTREDKKGSMDRFLQRGGKTSQAKLKALRSLKITMASFCTFTIEFILQMTGLEKITVGVNRTNVEEWDPIQKELFDHKFLDFLCARTVFDFRSVQMNYNEENEYMHGILRKLYHQLPPHEGKTEHHVQLVINNNSPESGLDYNNMFSNIRNFVFEMRSEINSYHTLVRTASFTHFIQHEGSLRNRSLKYLGHMNAILDDITSLTFDTFGMWVIMHVVPFIFQDTLQQFRNLKKVYVHLSKNYSKQNSFLKRDITTPHVNLEHLEITAGNALCIEEDMLPVASSVFPSLKYLALWFHCGWFNGMNEFVIMMMETQLERLYLDVTPVRVQMYKLGLELPYFILKVVNGCKETRYRVSLDYLAVTEEEEGWDTEDEVLTVCITFKSISYINLYLHRNFSDQFRPVSVSDPKDLIQTVVCIK